MDRGAVEAVFGEEEGGTPCGEEGLDSGETALHYCMVEGGPSFTVSGVCICTFFHELGY